MLSRIRATLRSAVASAVAAFLVAPAVAQDHPARPAATPSLRLGVFFWHDSPNDDAALEGIVAALAEVGRPHELLVGRAGEDRERAIRTLGSFAERGVDLVFAMGTQAALVAAEHVTEIPVVFTAVTNPVESRVVRSWSGSGTNLAGNSNWIPPATILQVFRMTVPDLTSLGVLRSTDGVVSAAELHSLRDHLTASPALHVAIVEAVVGEAADLEGAVHRLVAGGAQAIWIPIDPLVYEHAPAVFRAAREHGVPIVSSSLRGTRAGAASGIVVDYGMLGKRAAAMALRILDEGLDPGALPVGTMHGYRVVVNLEAARQCSYELPLSLLLLADVLLEELETDG